MPKSNRVETVFSRTETEEVYLSTGGSKGRITSTLYRAKLYPRCPGMRTISFSLIGEGKGNDSQTIARTSVPRVTAKAIQTAHDAALPIARAKLGLGR